MSFLRAHSFARLWLCLVILFAGLELTSPAGALPQNLRAASDLETTDPSDFGSDSSTDEDGDADETAAEPLSKLLRESHVPLSHVRLRESDRHRHPHGTHALYVAARSTPRVPASARPFSAPPPLVRLLI